MENFSYSSYPDSRDSSPRSREIDCENASWDEPSGNYKVKFMCSYGGKIHPRPHDNQLAYVGGETKILAVDRNIKYAGIISKLSSLCETEVCFKYQLPGEDLDALISVTNDEDLEHMMLEYDRLYRASAKPARLRLFLFSANPSNSASFGSNDGKNERQWFVDALNSMPVQTLETSSPAAATAPNNPDFLFGLDRAAVPPAAKLQDPIPEPAVPNVAPLQIPPGSDSSKEDPRMGGEQIMTAAEMHRQIQELQRMQIASQEQAMYKRKSDENLARAYPGDYFVQKVPEKAPPQPSAPVPPAVSVPMGYWQQERHMTTGGYPAAQATATGTEQPVYLIHTPAGIYQQQQQPVQQPVQQQPMRPPPGTGQGYYTMQRMVPDAYRDPSVYGGVPPQAQAPAPAPPQPQPSKLGAYPEGVGMVRPGGGGGGGGVGGGAEAAGYAQVVYDSAGRQMYYTTSAGGVMPAYQNVAPAPAPVAGTFNQEASKVVGKVSQASV